jgi:hypothetical protein
MRSAQVAPLYEAVPPRETTVTKNYVLPGFAMKAAYGSLVAAVLVFISMLLLTGIHH